jgi:hypothetical protein
MNSPELCQKIEGHVILVHELQKIVDTMIEAPPQLTDAMNRVYESAKSVYEAVSES